jgi:predicted transcriptional regulator
MESFDLSDDQEELLTVVVDAYRTTESPVSGADVAEALDRNPGTIRNRMQNLKALNLVEGIPGPKGGYKPTGTAYEVLDRQDIDEPESLILSKDFRRADVTVEEIELPDVYDPGECVARIHFSEPIEGFESGDPIAIGPTPVTGLLLAGQVRETGPGPNEVLVDVVQLETPQEAEE